MGLLLMEYMCRSVCLCLCLCVFKPQHPPKLELINHDKNYNYYMTSQHRQQPRKKERGKEGKGREGKGREGKE